MTHHEDEQLAAWLADGPQHGPVDALEDALRTVRSTRQRPGWLVSVSGGTIAQQPGATIMRYAILAVTLVALVGLLVGALINGGLLPPKPSLPALVDNTAGPSPTEPVPSPSQTPPAGLVAYTAVTELEPGQGQCTEDDRSLCFESRIWVSNTDGSGAHRLLPNRFNGQQLLAWSSDGSRILYQGPNQDWRNGGDLMLTDPAGSERRRLMPDPQCSYPCWSGAGGAWSPDGTRFAIVQQDANGVLGAGPAEVGTVIAIVDIASGQVTELETTRTTKPPPETCSVSTQCEGMNDTPRWSPDGSHLVFARQNMSPEPGSAWTSGAVYVVNPDGSDLRRVTPEGLNTWDASWSPNGSQLVFVNTVMVVNADHTSVTDMLYDIYTVRPNGEGLRRLTNDGISIQPSWTADGRLIFSRQIGGSDANQFENWIMDADGANQTMLGTTLAQLTDAGCVACMYPLPQTENESLSEAFWQPVR
jgi:dipeptidyl aminopeptidase/acylaminoacyl peptidase